MIHDDLARFSIEDAPLPAPVDTFETAIAEVAEQTLALNSATARLAYADGARIRGEVEHGLSRAQALAERLADGAARAEALRQLGEMHAIATEALMRAPAPSLAAVVAVEAGNPALWHEEECAWIVARLAIPRLPTPRRTRRKTQPETPTALLRYAGTTTDDAGGVTFDPTVAPSPADKAGKV